MASLQNSTPTGKSFTDDAVTAELSNAGAAGDNANVGADRAHAGADRLEALEDSATLHAQSGGPFEDLRDGVTYPNGALGWAMRAQIDALRSEDGAADSVSAMVEAMWARSLAQGDRAVTEAAVATLAALAATFTYQVPTVGDLPGSATNGETALILTGADAGKIYRRTGGAWVFAFSLAALGADGLPLGLAASTLALPRVTAAVLADDLDAAARLVYTSGDGETYGLPAAWLGVPTIDLATLDAEIGLSGVTAYSGGYTDLVAARARVDAFYTLAQDLALSDGRFVLRASGVMVWAPSNTIGGPRWPANVFVTTPHHRGGVVTDADPESPTFGNAVSALAGLEMASDCLDKNHPTAAAHTCAPLAGYANNGTWGAVDLYVNNRMAAQDWSKFSGPRSDGNWAIDGGKAKAGANGGTGINASCPESGERAHDVHIERNFVTDTLNGGIVAGGVGGVIRDNHARNSDHDHPFYITSLGSNSAVPARPLTFEGNTFGGYWRGIGCDASNVDAESNCTDCAENPQRARYALDPTGEATYEYLAGATEETIRPVLGAVWQGRGSRRRGTSHGHARVDLGTPGLSGGVMVRQSGLEAEASIEHTGDPTIATGKFAPIVIGRGQNGDVVQGPRVNVAVTNAPSGMRAVDHTKPAYDVDFHITVRRHPDAPEPEDGAVAIRSYGDLTGDVTLNSVPGGAEGDAFSRTILVADTVDRPTEHRLRIHGNSGGHLPWFNSGKANADSVTDVTLHGVAGGTGAHVGAIASVGAGDRPKYALGSALQTVVAESTPATYTAAVQTGTDDDDAVSYLESHSLGAVPSRFVFTDASEALRDRYLNIEGTDSTFTIYFDGPTEIAEDYEGYLVVEGRVPAHRVLTVCATSGATGADDVNGTVLTSPDRIEFAHGLGPQQAAAVDHALAQTAGAPTATGGYPKAGAAATTAVLALASAPTAGDRYRVVVTI